MSTFDTEPRRKRRPWLILIPIILLALLGGAMAIPGSPIYLATLLEPDVKIGGRSRSEWTVDLSSPDAKTRAKAAASIGQMNTNGKRSMPELIKVMRTDPDDEVRAMAADAVYKMYPTTEPEKAKEEYAVAVLEPFTAALTDPEGRVRNSAASGLLKLKTKAKSALPVLLEGIKNPDNNTNLTLYLSTIRQVMLRAIGEAAAGTPEGVPTFVAILDIEVIAPKLPNGGGRAGQGAPVSPEVTEASIKYAEAKINRRIAVTGLGLAGEHGRASASKIRKLLTSDDPDDRIIAKEALERMGEPVDEK